MSRLNNLLPTSITGGAPFQFAFGLRQALREGYTFQKFRADALAGIVVGIVALPLSMALAIASGVPPQNGLYTAIVAGAIAAIAGGSRVQITGPTAAFVVLLAPVSNQYGLAGLAVASMLAGVILLLMGALRFGRLIEFIPYPVTIGFTAGIAIVIATLQLRDFLGLDIAHMPEHYIDKVRAIIGAIGTMHWQDVAVGISTLLLLIYWPRVSARVPAPLVALTLAAIAAAIIHHLWPSATPHTINARFGGVPSGAPTPVLPWNEAGPEDGAFVLDWTTFKALLGPAFAIAMLGAIESLLSAVVADGMTGFRHNSDAELVGQGFGNIIAPFFGGFAATGAIARTATSIRSGGRSPIAGLTHSVFVLLAVLLLAPLLGWLPMASLAALLMLVAWRMAEAKHVLKSIRIGPRSDAVVLVTCVALTVIFDMVIAVSVGVVLASLLFMRRMAEVGGIQLVGPDHPEHAAITAKLPHDVLMYDIAGPLFFGAAQKAMSSLHTVKDKVRCVILDIEDVPAIDATGLVNLQSALDRLRIDNIRVLIVGAQPQPMRALRRALPGDDERVKLLRTLEEAIAATMQKASDSATLSSV